ncbi:MAG: TonB-dependent receptor [Saprospiraceae bacterium]|nr:TonB-dependent receptor [Candidatus Parvibacillus calidus]MBX2936514.1 TonB-dependent receptor [Saprospiraceae bacterium]MCB0590363.1 TonB-dependent receptor [Saprospiraceae bacterium]MCO5282992.1 carboxypeptidase regulatory-like domain-containing protein [Saprospiraceae bacterium]MCO6471722.1 TonB-dependent receptor [Saprospiraceae bacterium]
MNFKSTLIAMLMFCVSGLMAQVTTSGMSGVVKDASGQLMIGASVILTHVPSGTVYGTVTLEDGRYSLLNLRVGGPYSLEVSSVGSETYRSSGIYLTLGDVLVNNVVLQESATVLEGVLITDNRNPVINGDRTGASTNIDRRMMERLPSISRSLTDFTRVTPQANGNSFAGRDGRMNNLQIDGANLNNAFGLSSDPLPGGGNQPISLDAIEEVQVNIAPYDVRQTGFTGAGINAVTKSGSNEVHGSVYAYIRPKSFTGLNVADYKLDESARTSSNIYGARVGGPIIKNKLLYFVSLEYENTETAGNNWLADNGSNTGQPNVTRVKEDDLKRVQDHLKTKYGYDPGAYQGYDNTYNNGNYKALARLDWNINDKHTFTARYSYMLGSNEQGTNGNSGPNPRSGNRRISDKSISFENANYSFKNTVSSVAAELNSRLSNKMSNQLILTYSRIQDTRSTPGKLFPFVDIGDGTSSDKSFSNYISFGTELFSVNNDVINNNVIITDNLTYVLGKNTLTAGLSYQLMSFANSYQRMGSSYYRYNTVDDFLSDAPPIAYGVTYVFDGKDPFARVKFGLAGLYLQDRIALTDKFNLTLGVRADMALFHDDPVFNPSVDTLAFLSPSGKVANYTTAKWPKSVPLFSPRLGFNYDIMGDRTLQLRGGTGIFTGNIPFVWFTNMPTNAGVIQNTFEPVSSAVLAKIDHFEADPKYWPNTLASDFPKSPSNSIPGGLNLIDPDFKMPQVWRSNLGIDIKIPNTPLILSADGTYTKDINGVYQYNVNRNPATQKMSYSGDTRDYWASKGDAQYNKTKGLNANVPMLTNINEGKAITGTFELKVPYYHGLSASVFYNYTYAVDVTGNPGSAAGSAWSNNYSVNDPNEGLLGYSQFAVPNRVGANLSYKVEYGMFATTFGLYYNGSNGGRYAWTYGNDINGDGVSLDLLYVPKNGNELTFAPLKVGDRTFTPEEQAAAFDKFISSVPELDDARGGYVKRNSGLLPWANRFDVKIMEDISFGGKNGGRKHTIQLGLDIFNVANLFNSEWGVYQTLNGGSNFNYPLLKVSQSSPSAPTFTMLAVGNELATTPFRNNNSVVSTWAMQFSARYIF